MTVGWPQGIVIALWVLILIMGFGKPAQKQIENLIGIILMAGLLYWGGFFG